MPKLRVQNRFGIIPNDLLNDPKISLKAKGLFGYLQSKPDDWDFSADRIKNDTKENRDAILSWLKELEQFWYLQRNRYKTEKWQWWVDYILYDKPHFDTSSSVENPQWTEDETSVENPTQENPTQENPTYNKERDTKKEIQKKIYIDNEAINNFIIEFIENRKQLKKPMTDLAITKLVNKCQNWLLKYKDDQIKLFFDIAIESGWQGVFELQTAQQSQKQQKKPQTFAYQWEKAREDFAF